MRPRSLGLQEGLWEQNAASVSWNGVGQKRVSFLFAICLPGRPTILQFPEGRHFAGHSHINTHFTFLSLKLNQYEEANINFESSSVSYKQVPRMHSAPLKAEGRAVPPISLGQGLTFHKGLSSVNLKTAPHPHPRNENGLQKSCLHSPSQQCAIHSIKICSCDAR